MKTKYAVSSEIDVMPPSHSSATESEIDCKGIQSYSSLQSNLKRDTIRHKKRIVTENNILFSKDDGKIAVDQNTYIDKSFSPLKPLL